MAASSYDGGADGAGLPSFQAHTNNYVMPEASESPLVRYRVLEFLVCVAMIGVAFIMEFVPIYQRAIPGVQIKFNEGQVVWALDPTINKEELAQHVPMVALLLICILVPMSVNLLVNYGFPRMKPTRIIAHDVRDYMLSMLMSIGISFLITQFLKNMTGRMRPCFYDMCGWDMNAVWDGVSNLCTNKSKENDARRSFPSLHASFSWSTLFLLTLYMMGRSSLNCENRQDSLYRGTRKIAKLFLAWTPTLLASWIAVTRSTENLHDYADIVAGALIGGIAASFAYGYNYGSIFSWETAGHTHQDFFDQHKAKNPMDLPFSSSRTKRRTTRRSVQRESLESPVFLKPSNCSLVENVDTMDMAEPEPIV